MGVVTWQGEEGGQGSSSGLLGLPLGTLLPRHKEYWVRSQKGFWSSSSLTLHLTKKKNTAQGLFWAPFFSGGPLVDVSSLLAGGKP